jgi:hypothetical protein
MRSLPEKRLGAASLMPLGSDLVAGARYLAFVLGVVGFVVGDLTRFEILLGRPGPPRLQLRLVHLPSPSGRRVPAQFGTAAGAMQGRRMPGAAEHASIALGESLYSRYSLHQWSA